MTTTLQIGLGARALADAPRATRRPRFETVLVVTVSLAMHGAIASSLDGGRARAEQPARVPTRIDIQVNRPPAVPPPPAEIPPPQETPKRVPPRSNTPRAQPQQAEPVAAPVATAEPTAVASPDAIAVAPTEPVARDTVPVANASGPPAPPAPPRRVEAREGANYQHNPRPSYPRIARREGWEGTVTLRVQVGANGRPLAIRVSRSSGREVLDEAAVEAVRGWSFTPATVDGQPVGGSVSVPIAFRLGQ